MPYLIVRTTVYEYSGSARVAAVDRYLILQGFAEFLHLAFLLSLFFPPASPRVFPLGHELDAVLKSRQYAVARRFECYRFALEIDGLDDVFGHHIVR